MTETLLASCDSLSGISNADQINLSPGASPALSFLG
ncbi:hypothetical protein L914_11381 [Phytophthora nicotianae]|uniref:Uncharacterized protein n=1 Tax=Phytophthora nicotianae TaxID=4792 RepID=W2N5Q4_PHYNI|nr:hypothetical protein L914_11381 [Phytophthora nicotianae]